ncbi:MAG: hypothetical protein KME43_19075 [Myxacorys chilensis ATA2-1-KO14]|jgi:two-component system CheB/CheR fusion protein|nr:hypothetical protein [Myxacorys chilensis ATA2-1-KO14]
MLPFDVLLEYIKRKHCFDFTDYKRSSLERRVQHRMSQLGIENYSEYLSYLEDTEEEFTHLFSAIEINYTYFFRDRDSWDYLYREIIPRIRATKQPDEPIRVWSAGCASGEETYTLAIVLAEALGIEQFNQRVHIFATDVDDDALEKARQGSYSEREVTQIPPHLLSQYFKQSNDRYQFRKDLRTAISFHRHNLVQHAPMSKIDLLVCRNTLIYFDVDAQTKVLVRFHFSLKDRGFLFLGKAEIVPSQLQLFKTLNVNHHAYTKLPKEYLSPHLFIKAFKRPR